VASEAEGLVEMMAASCREMVGGEEEVAVKERREEGIPGSALMMACSTGPHILQPGLVPGKAEHVDGRGEAEGGGGDPRGSRVHARISIVNLGGVRAWVHVQDGRLLGDGLLFWQGVG